MTVKTRCALCGEKLYIHLGMYVDNIIEDRETGEPTEGYLCVSCTEYCEEE